MTEKKEEQGLTFDPNQIEAIDDGDNKGKIKEPDGKADEEFSLNLFEDTNLEPLDKKKDQEEIKDTEKKKEEEIEYNDEKTPPSKETEDASFSVVLGQELMEEGVLSHIDEEELKKIEAEKGRGAAIKRMVEMQLEESTKEIKSTNDQSYQEYLNLLNGGAKKDQAAELIGIENYLTDVEKGDLKADSDEMSNARKEILALNFRITTKWDESKIQKYVDKMYDEGTDVEEIEDAVKSIKGFITDEKKYASDMAQKREQDIKDQQANELKKYTNFVDKTEEYFKGEKVTNTVKAKMVKSLTTPVQLKNGQVTSSIWGIREKDPIAFDAKVAYLQAIGFFEGKPLEKFMKAATTKQTSKLNDFVSDNANRSFSTSKGNSFKSDNRKGEVDPLFGVLGIDIK